MKDFTERLVGIMLVCFTVCFLVSLGVAHSAESKTNQVQPLQENEKHYFFCLQAQVDSREVHSTSGIIDLKDDVVPTLALDLIREYGTKMYKCSKDKVVVTAFNKIE